MTRTLTLAAAAVAAGVVALLGWQAASAPAPAASRPAIRVAPVAPQARTPRAIGKRPPMTLARPAWLVDMSGEDVFKLRFGAAFDTLDKNGDGRLEWVVIDAQGKLHPDQAGPEPLPATYDGCYLVDYLHHPASSDKDPAHPGQYIQTPESYEITSWKTWKEVVGATTAGGYAAYSSTGVCKKTATKTFCHYKNGYEQPHTCAWGVCSCYPGPNITLVTKEVCVEEEKVPTAFTKAQWLKTAEDHFKREDWNHDGKLDAAESAEYVCPAGS